MKPNSNAGTRMEAGLKRWLVAAVSAATLVAAAVSFGAEPAARAQAAPQAPRGPRLSTPGNTLEIQVPLYQSKVVSLDQPASRVSVANPDVADLVIISPTQFYVLAKDIGMTNVLVWDRGNMIIATVDVHVTHDLAGLKSRLGALLPGNQIAVSSAQRSIVLSGAWQTPRAPNRRCNWRAASWRRSRPPRRRRNSNRSRGHAARTSRSAR